MYDISILKMVWLSTYNNGFEKNNNNNTKMEVDYLTLDKQEYIQDEEMLREKKPQNDTNPSRLRKSFSVDLLATDICDLNGTQNNVDQYTEQLSC